MNRSMGVNPAISLRDPESARKRLCTFIRESVKVLRRRGVVLGLSGGLDSSVTAYLAKAAFPKNSLALILPERDSDGARILRARTLAERLKLRYEVIDITRILDEFGTYEIIGPDLRSVKKLRTRLRRTRKQRGTTLLQGLRPEQRPSYLRRLSLFYLPKLRTRMILLYLHAHRLGYALLGTTDKTEFLIGQYDTHGDGASDIECLMGLYKTQVLRLGEHLGIPRDILDDTSTPDLLPGLSNRDMLGITYEVLDTALAWLTQGRIGDPSTPAGKSTGKRILQEIRQAMVNAETRRRLPLSLEAP